MNQMFKINESLLGKVGIDRVKFLVKIQHMNFDELHNQETLSYASSDNYLKMEVIDSSTGAYESITSYKHRFLVHDGEFSDVSCGIEVKQQSNGSKKNREIVCELDIVMPRYLYNTFHNIYNVHNKEEVIYILNSVVNNFQERGIYLAPPNTWVVKSLELNKTFIFDFDSSKFNDCMRYMLKLNRQHSYYNKSHHHNENGNNTYSLESTRRHIKIYNKSMQVFNRYGVALEQNLMRVELLLNREGIKSAFKSNSIDILLDMTALSKIYYDAMLTLYKKISEGIGEEVEFFNDKLCDANFKSIDLLANKNSEKLFDFVYLAEAASKKYSYCNRNNLHRDLGKFIKKIDPNKLYRLLILECFFKLITPTDKPFNPIYKFSDNVQIYLNKN